MQLQLRDIRLLQTIYAFDGILSVDQIHRWFFPGKDNYRNCQRRLSKLHQAGYIQRPTREQQYRCPEPFICLATKGAETVADSQEKELEQLQWRETPKWSRLRHDIRLNEFRWKTTQAIKQQPEIDLREWRGQDQLANLFREKIAYFNEQGHIQKRRVYIDGFLYLQSRDQQSDLAFVVEYDNNTESNLRFARDKVSPILHLMLSTKFQRELQTQSGRILGVLHGSEARYNNIRQTITKFGGADLFLFTSYEVSVASNPLADPIWQLPHTDRKFSLLEYRTPDFQTYLQSSLAGQPKAQFLQPML